MMLGISKTRAADAVNLRGYGLVRASIAPQRSEFTCESTAKADILLGKLLADMFWDAGQNLAAKTVKADGREIVLREWRPYGVVIAGRNKNRVLVVGGKDEQSAIGLASKEPLLAASGTLFAPSKPYPSYLDYYDLDAVKCCTLGMHPENKFRYMERSAFMKEFFKGGYFNGGACFFGRTSAEGVAPLSPILDTDMDLAERDGLSYSISVSTGGWPFWARNKWPDFIDRTSSIHDVYGSPYLWCPPEALGMSALQRRQTSLAYMGDIMRRYKDSLAMAGWELYCGDFQCETYFGKGYQGHLGYTPAGLESFRRWLKEARGYSLADLGKRWYGDAAHFKEWSEVMLPDPDEFFGDFDTASLPIRDSWFWTKAQPGQVERPADDAPGWTPVAMPPSQQMMALPPGPSFWRASFDASNWLGKNAGKDVYLVLNVDNQGWRKTGVWLNGVYLGEHQSKSSPYSGPFALKVTGLIKAGSNKLCFQVAGGGNPIGPAFLTTALPQAYPYLGKLRNAQYVDSMEWRLYELNFKEADAMAYARSIDPDRPLIVCATSEEVKDGQGDALRQYGGSMQDTGYESSFRPFNSRLGYVEGFYGSCEASDTKGVMDADPTPFMMGATRRLGWTLINGEGMYKELRDPYLYYGFEKKTGWFAKNKRAYQLIGKYLPEKPDIAILHSSQSALLDDSFHAANWDIGRGELQASHYDNVYVTESGLGRGLADGYPVLFDTDTMIMDSSIIDAIRKYVAQGGTFIALQNTGRHSLLAPDTWPISQLTGFKVICVAKKGKIRFENNLPIFKGWEGKQFEGEGSALDFKDTQSADDVSVALAPAAAGATPLARWDDGSIAVGMRKIGKGRIIVLGSTFWRNGRDLGGTGTWKAARVEPVFLERLFTDLGVKRTADASTPDVFARKVITKNGLQEWLIAMNTTKSNVTADLGFASAKRPDAVWDMIDNSSVPFTYADGWVRVKDVAMTAYETKVYGVKRGTLSEGVDFWWNEKAKFWTRQAIVPPLTEKAAKTAADPATHSFETWKFFADRDGSVGSRGEWLKPAFDDGTWRTANNTPWNLQFDDLKDYGGAGLYRSLPFALPASWRDKKISLNMAGWQGCCWSSFDLYINGERIDTIMHPRLKVDVTDKLKSAGNILCIKLTGKKPGGDYPLSGLTGCAVWIEPEVKLAPSISLQGEWQAVHGDWATSQTVSVDGAPESLTDDGRLKPGVTPVKANHLLRDVVIPSDWRGKSVWLHIASPRMNPPAAGLVGGMLIINDQPIALDQWPNPELDRSINLTPDIKFGAANHIEIWPPGARNGSMADDNIVINDVSIGCAAK